MTTKKTLKPQRKNTRKEEDKEENYQTLMVHLTITK